MNILKKNGGIAFVFSWIWITFFILMISGGVIAKALKKPKKEGDKQDKPLYEFSVFTTVCNLLIFVAFLGASIAIYIDLKNGDNKLTNFKGSMIPGVIITVIAFSLLTYIFNTIVGGKSMTKKVEEKAGTASVITSVVGMLAFIIFLIIQLTSRDTKGNKQPLGRAAYNVKER